MSVQVNVISMESTPRSNLPSNRISIFTASPRQTEGIQGGLVLIQEVFGLNDHIRSLACKYASEGYVTWAPAYFDHFEPLLEFGYDTRSTVKGRDLVAKLGWDQALADTLQAAGALRLTLPESKNKVATVGFCWGGTVAWLTACRAQQGTPDAAVSYYGRAIWEFRNETPERPVLLHYGANDPLIPSAQVHDVKSAHPEIPVLTYDAGHGFNCEARSDYNEEAARLAHERTMRFLREKMQ